MTEICLGTWAWGNKLIWGYEPKKDDLVLQKTFLEAIYGGLTLIDTADSYGIGKDTGRSEQLIGEYIEKLHPNQRKNIRVATKLAPFPWRLGRNGLKRAFTASKQRLQGHVHRVQLHWSTARYAPWQESQLIDGLGDLVENNDVAEIGISNTGPKRLKLMHARLKSRGISIKSLQIQMSLLSPEPEKEEMIKNTCDELEIDLLAYSPLALGILGIPPEESGNPSTFLRKSLFKKLLPKTINIRQALYQIGKDNGASQVQVALNWCKANGASPIIGIRNVFQAKDAIQANKWELNKEEKRHLDLLRSECNVRMPNNPFVSD